MLDKIKDIENDSDKENRGVKRDSRRGKREKEEKRRRQGSKKKEGNEIYLHNSLLSILKRNGCAFLVR